MSEINPQIVIRPALADDANFIFNSWLKSYKASQDRKHIIDAVYYSEQHFLIEQLLKKAKVLVACSTEDSTQVYGYICADIIDNIFCLHYAYIKQPFRRMGIFNQLLAAFNHTKEGTAGVYTHHTKIMEILRHKYNLLYHPYVLTNGYYKFEREDKDEQ